MRLKLKSSGTRRQRALRMLCGMLLLVTAGALRGQPAAPFDGPPPGRGEGQGNPPPGDFFRGGPGGPGLREKRYLVSQFDKNNNHWLNAEERQAAREFLKKEQAEGRGRRGPGRPGGFGPPGMPGRAENSEPPQPGPKVAVGDAKTYPGVPLYDSNTVRTVFLEFESADWEKELADFHDTDVEVPAKMIVDGKTYQEVGVHFRGMSSYMMVGEGHKRSLNVSLDSVHKKQNIDGYRTLNLLNSHEDPSFLRSVLFYQIAREYVPAPKAGFVRVVINGESWGVYVSVEQFNKDFVKEWFGTTKGARWKVPGSPNGQGSLKYVGDDPAKYKKIYEIKTKDDPKSWADLIKLCKVLNETPASELEKAIAPLLDIEGALKFLALDNALINNDGYWVRTSDYALYEDEKGRFHVLPQDANETFSKPGGPGFGGPGGFGPGMMLAPQILSQADKNADRKLTRGEFTNLADSWFDKFDGDKKGSVSQDQFSSGLAGILPTPGPGGGFGPPGGGAPGDGPRGRGGRGGFGSANFIGGGLFGAADADKDGLLTRAELKKSFDEWFAKWDAEKTGTITEEQLRAGLSGILPAPNFGGPGGGRGRGPGGPGGRTPIRVNGVELDPLAAAGDAEKPLISKLLAVPALRTRYLGYVRETADQWLDWNKLGPLAQHYHTLIADDVKADTRKLDSTEDFLKGLTEDIPGRGFGPGGAGTIGLKNFADQRRAYLLRPTDGAKDKGQSN